MLGGAALVGLMILLFAVVGKQPKNNAYQPQNEFKLDPWIHLKIGSLDLSVNKAVLYLLIAAVLTTWTMVYIARRMRDRPNNVQTAVEAAYDLVYTNITRGNMDAGMAAKWFPFIGATFFFILYSNLIGYIPLPVNTEYKIDVFGAHLPAFAIYAATANISVTLVLTLVVWFSYHVEGIRAKGAVSRVGSRRESPGRRAARSSSSRRSRTSCGSSRCPSGCSRTCSPATS